MYGDATSSPDPIAEAYYIVSGRHGQRVAFNGEINDIDGGGIRIESSVRPVNDPPDIDEGKGYIRVPGVGWVPPFEPVSR